MADIRIKRDANRPLAHFITVGSMEYLADSREVEGRYYETLVVRKSVRGEEVWNWCFPVLERRYTNEFEMVMGHYDILERFAEISEKEVVGV